MEFLLQKVTQDFTYVEVHREFVVYW